MKYIRARTRVCVCVCVCVCVWACARVKSGMMHVLYMPRVEFCPRADALVVQCWFCLQFQTRYPWKHWNRPQNYQGSLSLLLALKLFLKSFIHKWKSALGQNRIDSSPQFTCKVLTFKYWWSALSSKVLGPLFVKKLQIGVCVCWLQMFELWCYFFRFWSCKQLSDGLNR